MKLAAAQSDLPHSSRIELTGSARATERSILGFETGGRIAKLNVDVGERFARGQVMAELDAEPDRLRVTQAQASLAAAEAGLMDRRVQTDQQRRLLESEVISCCVRERQGAASGRRGPSAHCQGSAWLAERAQRGTMIVAPFDGVVAEKLALAFTDIAAGAPVFQVDGVRSGTEIIANASTTQAPHIDVGQRAELFWSGAEQPIRAVVRRVGLRAENGSLLPVVLVPEDNAQARALRPVFPYRSCSTHLRRPPRPLGPRLYPSLMPRWCSARSRVRLPSSSTPLQIRRCTVARCASRRHRKETARASSLDLSPARRWLPPEADGSPMDSQ